MSDASASLGQRLLAERAKKGLSAQKAADELHLDIWIIDGLESGDYARIGPPVYAKGHLKRYAEFLGLPVAEVIEGFDGQAIVPDAVPSPSTIRMRTNTAYDRELPWVAIGCAAAAVLVLVAGLWLWRSWHFRTPPPATAPAAGVAAPSVVQPDITSDAASGAAAAPAPPVAAGPVVEANPGAASGRARLRLTFLADTWVDVHDASGQRLFAGNGRINNVRSMSGDAPFRVYLKSAASIRMEINNHVVTIGPQFVVDNAAHFEAGADGVLRRDPHAAPIGATAAPTPAPAAAHPRG